MVSNPERFYPPLLTTGQRNEKAEFNELWLGEMRVELYPELLIGNPRIPEDGAGVSQGSFLPG